MKITHQEEGDTQWEEGFSRALSSSALSTILEKKRHEGLLVV